eukprot:4549985-Prymnesium_polylepis.2
MKGSGTRVRKAPEPTWEVETRRVASRCGTTAAALEASKASLAALASSPILFPCTGPHPAAREPPGPPSCRPHTEHARTH